MPFDLSMTKLLVLGVIAMIVFGPDKLPQVARDAGRMLRQFRAFAQQARTDLKSELGDTIGDFDLEDLNPKRFVRKHLLEGFDDTAADVRASVADIRSTVSSAGTSTGTTARATMGTMSTVGTVAASAVVASAVVAATPPTGSAGAASTGSAPSTTGSHVAAAQPSSPAPFDSDAT